MEAMERNIDGISECMRDEYFRLSSFANFPERSGGKPLKLAKAGFLFTPIQADDDTVTCFSCKSTMNKWMRFEDPMEIHKILSPDCDFIKGTSENIGISVPQDDVYQQIKAKLREQYGGDTNEICRSRANISQVSNTFTRSQDQTRYNSQYQPNNAERNLLSTNGTTATSSSELLINESINNPSPVPSMQREDARLMTFSSWPSHLLMRPRELAKAGFYYLGSADRVQCAFCKGILRDWDNGESPVAEHRRYFSHCTFMRGLDDRNIPLIHEDRDASFPGQRTTTAFSRNQVTESEDNIGTAVEDDTVTGAVEDLDDGDGAFGNGVREDERRNKNVTVYGDDNDHVDERAIRVKRYFTILKKCNMKEHEIIGSIFSKLRTYDEIERLRLRKENEALKASRFCKICWNADSDTLLLPCCHLSCCSTCWWNILCSCPFCRRDVLGFVNVKFK